MKLEGYLMDKLITERATELEWLKFFYNYADFGPAHEDCLYMLMDLFKGKTGKMLPENYDYRKNGDDIE